MTASLGDGDDESPLLVLAGGVTGFVTGELVRTERLLVEATSGRSALRERERLARTVHDGVLQLLALVQRQARDGTADWDVLASDAVLAVLHPQVAQIPQAKKGFEIAVHDAGGFVEIQPCQFGESCDGVQ
ncbi:MAG: hypothetical protein QOI69_609 [Pseudonocardiales bacterium]|nr:hypothetical protein [Pseudonocardiales bacterium]